MDIAGIQWADTPEVNETVRIAARQHRLVGGSIGRHSRP
jgi:hypothetical protein